MKAHVNDYATYEQLLLGTEDGDGRMHRDHAVKLYAEILASNPDRLEEMARAHAARVADRFDDARDRTTVDGQTRLADDTVLRLGGAERVHVSKARDTHWREWWALQQQAHLREQRSFVAKADLFDRLLPILVEHGCTVLEAQALADAEPVA